MTDLDSWLKNQTHEQLEIFYKNQEYRIKRLAQKLRYITGCGDFGDADGMDGACVECFYNNKDQYNRCLAFEEAFAEYRETLKDKRE